MIAKVRPWPQVGEKFKGEVDVGLKAGVLWLEAKPESAVWSVVAPE